MTDSLNNVESLGLEMGRWSARIILICPEIMENLCPLVKISSGVSGLFCKTVKDSTVTELEAACAQIQN